MRSIRRNRDIILFNDRPSKLEALAWDLAAFGMDYDAYEFRDSYDSLEEAAAIFQSQLSRGDVDGFISSLLDFGEIDYDPRLERRRKDLLSRLRRLRWPRRPYGRCAQNAETLSAWIPERHASATIAEHWSCRAPHADARTAANAPTRKDGRIDRMRLYLL